MPGSERSASGSNRSVIRPCTTRPMTGAADRVRELVERDPVVLVEIAGAIAESGRTPPDAITELSQQHAPRILAADPAKTRAAVEFLLMGREVDLALEWLQHAAILRVL